MKIGIITVCDSNYLIHFETFYKSFLLNETNSSVILEHFYIYKNQNEINQFKKKYSILDNFKNININFIKYDSSYSCKIIIFCGHYRFTALKYLMNLNKYDSLLYLDVDSYINKSVFNICNEIKESFGVFLRINKKKNYCERMTNTIIINNRQKYKSIREKNRSLILSGAIFSKCDENSKILLNNITELMNNSTKNWSTDQSILDKIFLKYVNIINIYVLPKTFLDFYCSKNTNIHFCKGKEFNWKRSKWRKIIYNTRKKFKIKFNIT
jgi:hypothetical protein